MLVNQATVSLDLVWAEEYVHDALVEAGERAECVMYGVGVCPHDGARQAVRTSLDALGDEVAPFAADRAFLSFNEHDRRLAASFPDPVADRLVASIRAYDPDDLLQANHLGR